MLKFDYDTEIRIIVDAVVRRASADAMDSTERLNLLRKAIDLHRWTNDSTKLAAILEVSENKDAFFNGVTELRASSYSEALGKIAEAAFFADVIASPEWKRACS